MVNIIILPNVFITDIITNSSSEIFICNTDKTIEAIEEVIQGLYNLLYDGRDFKEDMTVEQITEQTYNTYWEYRYGDWRADEDEEMVKCQLAWEKVDKNLIVIRSTNDNSIPFELFTIFEYQFDAEREHIG